ncbi:MAG: type II toxin-antitoxin system ParD family antitoxin [Verrucomicrobia bacterium]|jgi:antitoxin ParD1/3/4|nr:type II toxin-antitoxin system ParD family antitoxin [Verrucomicrobiota bacterium]
MSRNTSVELGDEIAGFIDHQVTAGRYGSASEVIRAGIRLLQDQETKMEALRLALREGEESGPSVPFEMDSFIQSRKSKK